MLLEWRQLWTRVGASFVFCGACGRVPARVGCGVCVCVCVRYRTYIMAHLRLGNLVIDQQRTYHKVWQVLLVDDHWSIILSLVHVLSLFVSLVNVS